MSCSRFDRVEFACPVRRMERGVDDGWCASGSTTVRVVVGAVGDTAVVVRLGNWDVGDG